MYEKRSGSSLLHCRIYFTIRKTSCQAGISLKIESQTGKNDQSKMDKFSTTITEVESLPFLQAKRTSISELVEGS
jgi:hypothetical protein